MVIWKDKFVDAGGQAAVDASPMIGLSPFPISMRSSPGPSSLDALAVAERDLDSRVVFMFC